MRRPISRQGFASFSAVILVGTTAIALTALAQVTAYQASRTKHAAADAQLRQLLHAGQAYVEASISSSNTPTVETGVPLPGALVAEGATLSIERIDPAKIVIRATYQSRAATTTLGYSEKQDEWLVEEIVMP